MSFQWSFLLIAAAAQTVAAQSTTRAKAAGGSAVTAFVNVSVIPMDKEQVLTGQTVLVRGNTIAEVGPAGQVTVPAGATRVDGQGKFLMPGLADMHVRIFPSEDNGKVGDWYAEPRMYCYVANGVTTIRVMAQDTMFVDLLERFRSGSILGPRMYVTGTLNWGDTAAQRFPKLKAAGYDFVHVTQQFVATPEALDTFVAAAKQSNLRLAGDVPVPLARALSAPYGSIEQLQGYLEAMISGEVQGFPIPHKPTTMVMDSMLGGTLKLDQTKIPALAAETKTAGVWNVPMETQAEQMIELWTGDSNAAQTSPTIAARRKLIKALHDAGAGLLLGTGAPTWGSDYGFAAHKELERLVAAGLTPYQALETGTRNAATFLGAADSAGTIAAGKRADLVLLTGNPLESIKSTAKPAGVMLNGQWLTRAKLDAKLKADDCVGR